MGAKVNEDEAHRGNGGDCSSSKSCITGGEAKGAHLARDGDASLGDGGDDGDDDDYVQETGSVPLIETDKKKKKKRKLRKKKAKTSPTFQSDPPRALLGDILASGKYPKGEIQDYTTCRTTPEELRRQQRKQLEDPHFLNEYRKAAEIHRQVRHWVQDTVKPGWSLGDIANGIEDGVRALLGNQGIETGSALRSGMGFPTGLCLNHEVAHYTPNPGQKPVVLQHSDVMKVDFGVHINGWIVDSAFTMSFDPVYDTLLAAVKDATNTGIKAAGIDVRICDVSAAIQEAMESYELEIGGKSYPVKPVRDLCAHNIKQYHIHGGKSIPFVKNKDETKMEEGEVFAIETFGSTGRGRISSDVGIYGYGLSTDTPKEFSLPFASANCLYKVIRENFGTIVWCRRYLDRLGQDRYLAGLNSLVSNGVLEAYEPLADIKGSYSAQFEHTILLRESSKEVLSRGSDY